MANLREFLDGIFDQLELDKEDEKIKGFIEAVPEQDLPDDFEDTFHKNYLTLNAAKNHADISSHFETKHVSSYNNANLSELKNILPEDKIAEVNEEKTLTQKIRKAYQLVTEFYKDQIETEKSKKKTDKDDGKVKELTDQINTLNKEKSELEETHTSKIGDLNKSFEKERVSSKISDLLGNYKFATNETITNDDIKTLIRSKLSALPYTIKNTDDGYKVFQKDSDAEAFDNNKPITVEGLIEKYATPFVEKSKPSNPDTKKPITTDNGQVNKYSFGSHATK